jgi:hypothetical protein
MNLNSKISKKFPLESNQNQRTNSKNMKKGKQQNKKKTSNKTLNFFLKKSFEYPLSWKHVYIPNTFA